MDVQTRISTPVKLAVDECQQRIDLESTEDIGRKIIQHLKSIQGYKFMLTLSVLDKTHSMETAVSQFSDEQNDGAVVVAVSPPGS